MVTRWRRLTVADSVPHFDGRNDAMTRSDLRNFHGPLPSDLHRGLRAEAERSGEAATVLARRAIEAWLRQREAAARLEAIAAYAAEHGGTEMDLDEQLEAASVEHLSKLDGGS